MVSSYPKDRQSFFCNRCIRAAQKSCLAQTAGVDAMALLTTIAHTEDAKRYSGPVTFYNQQLLPILGFAKWERLDSARKRLTAAGWLVYECQGKRKPGVYWTLIPDEFSGVDDSPMDEGLCTLEGYRQGYNEGYKQGYKEGIDRDIKRVQSGIQSGGNEGDNEGYPSNLSPIPIPVPIPIPEEPPIVPHGDGVANGKPKKDKPAYSTDFENFWLSFPKHKRKSKAEAYKAWQKAIKSVDIETLIAKAGEYNVSEIGRTPYAHQASTWLNQGCWEDDPEAWKRSEVAKPKTQMPADYQGL